MGREQRTGAGVPPGGAGWLPMATGAGNGLVRPLTFMPPSPAQLHADPSETAPAARTRPALSLRTKGLLAFAALLVYATALGVFVGNERQKLLAQVQELEVVHRIEEQLVRANGAAGQVSMTANDAVFQPESDLRGLLLGVEALQAGMTGLARQYGERLPSHAAVGAAVEALQKAPTRASIIVLRERLADLSADLDRLTRHVRDRRMALSEGYRAVYSSITMVALALGLVGVVLFGALITFFFTRLAADIKRLEDRAIDIVKGYRGSPLEVNRSDEVGVLMQAVNRMEGELAGRERQLAMSTQIDMHREKMAAMGSLAAGIAHEIGNPIAAISGVAQSICDTGRSNGCNAAALGCRPDLILEQTQRIAAITREIADFSRVRPAEPELLDLNGIVRSTCGFLRYDRRFRGVEIVLDLDTQLPAVTSVGDELVQVLMNLLVNAADALEGRAGAARRIVVRTRGDDAAAHLSVSDNGCGMDPQTAARAFEAFFTTKPPGRGTGLGLSLCRTLAEKSGGSVSLESEPGAGTTVMVTLPLGPSAQQGG